jgi:hypothetical protein
MGGFGGELFSGSPPNESPQYQPLACQNALAASAVP